MGSRRHRPPVAAPDPQPAFEPALVERAAKVVTLVEQEPAPPTRPEPEEGSPLWLYRQMRREDRQADAMRRGPLSG